MQELDGAAVRLEAIRSHRELMLLAADVALDATVADAAVDPVVEAVMEIARLRMRVADAPAVDDRFALVGLVVAIGVLEVDELRRRGHDDAFAGEDDAGGQIELVGEHGELVRLAIAIGVFADFDAVLALAVLLDAVRIIPRFHDPAPPALIPRESDRLGNIRLAGEEFQFAIRRHLRAFHAGFDAHAKLQRERFWALLVVRHLWVFFALFGFALRQKSLVGGSAFGGEFGEDEGLKVRRGGLVGQV